jgi:hypothetical protein
MFLSWCYFIGTPIQAAENIKKELYIDVSGDLYSYTPKAEYDTAKIIISGDGLVDIADATIKGKLEIYIPGCGRVLHSHAGDASITIKGDGDIYNFTSPTGNQRYEVSGDGKIYNNTWYPRWYLTRPWIKPLGTITAIISCLYYCWHKHSSHLRKT